MSDTDVINAAGQNDCCDAANTPADSPDGVASNAQAYLDWLKACKESLESRILVLEGKKDVRCRYKETLNINPTDGFVRIVFECYDEDGAVIADSEFSFVVNDSTELPDLDTDTFATYDGTTITFADGTTYTPPTVMELSHTGPDGTGAVASDCVQPSLLTACGTERLPKGSRVLRAGDTNPVRAVSSTKPTVNVLRSALIGLPVRAYNQLASETDTLVVINPYSCAALEGRLDFGGRGYPQYDTLNHNSTGSHQDVQVHVQVRQGGAIRGEHIDYSNGFASEHYQGNRFVIPSDVVTTVPPGGAASWDTEVGYTNFHFSDGGGTAGPNRAEDVPARVIYNLPRLYFFGVPSY